MARIGRPPTCICGDCGKCQSRTASREYWRSLTLEERRERIARRDPEAVRAAERARYERHKAQRLAAHKAYMQTDAGKAAHARAVARQNEKAPEKVSARYAVGNAIRDGKLVRQPCESCGTEVGVHAHHDDYSKPLDVRWLCAKHHREHHARENREDKAA